MVLDSWYFMDSREVSPPWLFYIPFSNWRPEEIMPRLLAIDQVFAQPAKWIIFEATCYQEDGGGRNSCYVI
jgi:hypothetical protein